MTNLQLAIQFFLQLAIILMVCRVVGIIAARFGQPQVVAEMIAGVCMGPSLLGLFAPTWGEALFPKESMKVLFPVSQLGLALYMFIVGLEFRIDIVQKRFKSSVAVSFAGMAAPFVLGAIVGWFLWNHTTLFPKATSMQNAMIFMGASMCITAFPMLARIIHFKGLAGTTMGTVAIGAGAIDDAAAWGMLAVVLASFSGDFSHAVLSIGGGIAYVLVAHLVIRPILTRYAKAIEARGKLSDGEYAFFLSLMCLGAWWTDYIELHAVFGAFVMGSAMPRGVVNRTLIERTQPLAVALILPLFFTYSGLNTRLGLLNSGTLWLLCGAVLAAAILGKGVACWAAARASGISNKEAMGIGVLMNARGLMELIIINIGLQKGIISAEIFAMLAIMAVITTLMASPIFERLVGTGTFKGEPEAGTEI
ncbi:cation:proton antiporter [Prosthecobacter sp.]|jgi:Kef-type K+ transport system membrane component KefB|uniref:cation:proton antiporter domain-containing protein n=1 Tax=Prosthecobacter sp. TaxID=1965333 RepID=UPI0037850D26